MYKAPLVVDPQQARTDSLQERLRALDLRIARMRELHAGSTDLLAHRLIKHSLVERDEIVAKLKARPNG
jgi:hypothetical protein